MPGGIRFASPLVGVHGEVALDRTRFPGLGRHPVPSCREPRVRLSTLAGLLGLVLLVNYLEPPNPVESEFSHFIQERERMYDNQRKVLFTNGQWQLRDERNPFSQPISFSDKNPFQE
ncbi:MAG: hypothetical protein P8Y94_08010 [Acidobacteriota bacterium]